MKSRYLKTFYIVMLEIFLAICVILFPNVLSASTPRELEADSIGIENEVQEERDYSSIRSGITAALGVFAKKRVDKASLNIKSQLLKN